MKISVAKQEENEILENKVCRKYFNENEKQRKTESRKAKVLEKRGSRAIRSSLRLQENICIILFRLEFHLFRFDVNRIRQDLHFKKYDEILEFWFCKLFMRRFCMI